MLTSIQLNFLKYRAISIYIPETECMVKMIILIDFEKRGRSQENMHIFYFYFTSVRILFANQCADRVASLTLFDINYRFRISTNTTTGIFLKLNISRSLRDLLIEKSKTFNLKYSTDCTKDSIMTL